MRITVCTLVGLVFFPAAFAVPARHLSGALYGREGKSPIARDATIPLLPVVVRPIGDATEKPLYERSQAKGQAGRDVPIAAGVVRHSLGLNAHPARSLEDRGDGNARQALARDPGIIFRPNNPTSLTFGSHIFRRRADGDLD